MDQHDDAKLRREERLRDAGKPHVSKGKPGGSYSPRHVSVGLDRSRRTKKEQNSSK